MQLHEVEVLPKGQEVQQVSRVSLLGQLRCRHSICRLVWRSPGHDYSLHDLEVIEGSCAKYIVHYNKPKY